MYSYSAAQWVLFFLFYCFVGWCIESSFVSIRRQQAVNRGFLRGPVIPIYGFGAISILFATLPVRQSAAAVFVLGMLAASVLEYVTGAVMLAVFQVRYWDYSEKPWNLHGHIWPGTSLAWGALSMVLVTWLHKPVERLVLALPAEAGRLLSMGLLGLFLADTALSVKAALDLRQLLEQMQRYAQDARAEAHRLQKRLEVQLTFKAADLRQRLPDSGEALQRRIEAMERLAKGLTQTSGRTGQARYEDAHRLRTDLAVWKARRAAMHENVRQRLTWDKRALLRGNPSAKSVRYTAPLQLLRQRLDEDRAARKSRGARR